MWEADDLGNEDILWASMAFQGGIGGHQQATCGAISASTVCLGLRHRCPMTEEERAQQARLAARRDASELARDFNEKFGDIICRNLVEVDFSDPEAARRFRESSRWEEKCLNYVQFVIEKLYELNER